MKPWIEMTELERFIDALEGTLLAHADAEDVKLVIERLRRAVDTECRIRQTQGTVSR